MWLFVIVQETYGWLKRWDTDWIVEEYDHSLDCMWRITLCLLIIHRECVHMGEWKLWSVGTWIRLRNDCWTKNRFKAERKGYRFHCLRSESYDVLIFFWIGICLWKWLLWTIRINTKSWLCRDEQQLISSIHLYQFLLFKDTPLAKLHAEKHLQSLLEKGMNYL